MSPLQPLIVLLVAALAAGTARADVVPEATALPPELSLDDALRIFHARGLDLLIAEANTRNAEGAVLIAGAVPNPTLSATVGNAFTYANTTASQQDCLKNGAVCSPATNNLTISDPAPIHDTLPANPSPPL